MLSRKENDEKLLFKKKKKCENKTVNIILVKPHSTPPRSKFKKILI